MTSILIVIAWFGMVYWFKENTCVMNNHVFQFQKNRYVCNKCGLIKKVVKND